MANFDHDIMGNRVAFADIRPHAAATATEKQVIWRAPFDAKLISVEIIPDTAATGDNTNSTNVNLINAGTAGSGSTEIGNVDFATGTNAVAGTAISLYAPADGLAVDAGTQLHVQLEKVGTGLALGGFLAVITYQGN